MLVRQRDERVGREQHSIEIVLGPVTAYSASPALLRGAADLMRKHRLCGHNAGAGRDVDDVIGYGFSV